MDRSFLTNPAIIRASRAFVCIRLATYESKAEAEVLKDLYVGPSGTLQNSVYAMLAPDGKQRLTRTGRSPHFAFGREDDAPELMVRTMKRLAKRYKRKGASTKDDLALPLHANFRLALNVAACDNRPLVVAYQPDVKQLAQLTKDLRDVAWQPETIGRTEYVTVTNKVELQQIRDLRKDARPGVYVLRPGAYGEFGRVLGRIEPGYADTKSLKAQLVAALDRFEPIAKDRSSHVGTGRSQGVQWNTKIPVTDTRATQDRGRRSRRR